MASVSITFHALTVRPYWVRVDGQAVADFATRREAETFVARDALTGGPVFDPGATSNGQTVQW